MNTLKKTFLIAVMAAFTAPFMFAQNDSTETVADEKPVDNPVKATFGTNMLIDNQTVMSPYQGSLNLIIYHRFSNFTNGIHDLFGIYGSANTRIGLEYGITDRIMVGIGTTKDYKLQDVEWKYAILQQTQSGSMPVSLSYYGNFVIDARDKSEFGPASEYKAMHRFSYFTQLILARKFNKVFSFQAAPEFAWFNGIANEYKNMNFGLSLGARAKFLPSQGLIAEYDIPFFTNNTTPASPKPNIGLGWEIGTSTHCFQIFVANYNQIIYQRNLVFNDRGGFSKENMQVGFNITVRF